VGWKEKIGVLLCKNITNIVIDNYISLDVAIVNRKEIEIEIKVSLLRFFGLLRFFLLSTLLLSSDIIV
jgi:hypothetical protein